MPRSSSALPRASLVIECVAPELDGGRHPAKRIVGDIVSIGADILKEGHDLIAARLLSCAPGSSEWFATAMRYHYDSDRWYAELLVDRVGTWRFTIEGWTDHFGTWRAELRKKVDAGQQVDVELQGGAQLVRSAARAAKSAPVRASLAMTAKALADTAKTPLERRLQRAFDDDLLALMAEHARPRDLTRLERERVITVDRERARFAAWYELFPRSQTERTAGDAHPRHGTFDDAAARLPRVAELGFDVVYLPPIHPIGVTFRKGKNNALLTEPDDVGSPWAIGGEGGGHTSIHPDLGTIGDFDRFVRTASALNLEVALDYALQCSPDHPWVKEHPEWFHVRADGSIQYAENPPKKYQDIYPLDLWCADREHLWQACRDIFLFWIGHGVKTFRVDNPHTKAFAFWKWVIREIQSEHPDTIFFAEAFTRPKKMKLLAKLGFTMSYTYFTWKNSAWELREYLEELTNSPMVDYYRGNLFTNTPDILHEYLVHGGRAAFKARLLLAGTLSPLYGIYSGFELCENVPVRPGSEEYHDSEKYQLKPRDWQAAGNINEDVRRLNQIRRSERALQLYSNLSFHNSENPAVLCYRKAARERLVQWIDPQGVPGLDLGSWGVPRAAAVPGEGDLLIVVNTDPHHAQKSMVHVPIHEMGIDDDTPYVAHDLLDGSRYEWHGVRNYVLLDPAERAGHVFRIER
jgi:starch synthase (maltosyl-transferring)